MTNGLWRIAHWKRIPVHLHWSVLLGLLWFLVQTRSLPLAAMKFVAFFGLLAIHEIGHARAALRRGTRVHEIRLYLLHGVCRHAWPRSGFDHIVIAWGGVLAQGAVLAVAIAARALAWAVAPGAAGALSPVFDVLIGVNLFMIGFNLLPVAPLDGHIAWRILRPLPHLLARRWRATVDAIRRAWRLRRRRGEMKRDAENKVVDLMERIRKK